MCVCNLYKTGSTLFWRGVLLFFNFLFLLLLLNFIFVVEPKPVLQAMSVQQSCAARQKKLFNAGAAGNCHSGWIGCLSAGFSDSASGFLRVK